MKNDLMTKMYALLGSVALAIVATAGIAVLMTQSGEQTWAQASAGVAKSVAQADAKSAAKSDAHTLSAWKAAPVTTRQVM